MLRRHSKQIESYRLQSPKFQFLQQDLKDVFSASLMREEWKKRVRYQLRKQLVFDAIEYRDYNENLTRLIAQIQREVLSGEYIVRKPKRFLAEKSRGLCRQMTLVHPRDLLVLERLSRSIFFELKSKAPSTTAFFEPDDGNFVKGFQQIDHQYGSFASWKRFQKAVFGFAKENNYIVITDVANFYDFINFQHLRNIIASLANIREAVLDLLIHVLNRMTWTPDFMPLTQIGMPQIETSATRVLANAMLYEVDRVCENSAISNYARFMDDMDIGVETMAAAKAIVRDLDLTLQSRQLRLNSSKTRILSRAEAFDHFCIKENAELLAFAEAIEKGDQSQTSQNAITSKYESWLDRKGKGEPGSQSPFRRENGSKIHKFIFSLMHECGCDIPDGDLIWLIKNTPAMRSTALRYLPYSSNNNAAFAELTEFVLNSIFVDDASFVEITGYLLHGKFRRFDKLIRQVRNFCRIASQRGGVGLHGAIFVASKFLPREELTSILMDNLGKISEDFWLCRAAAGVSPRFIHTPDYGKFRDILSRLESEDAYSVSNYFMNLSDEPQMSPSLKAYLTASNDSYPQKLYFPKVLSLLAISKNKDAKKIFPKMHALHPALKSDPFFHQMGF
ncbi:RNA-directed DNA polymerase [Rhizobium laguerreae]|uniref:RNA-directed DNA polymerase n=1 Tax=Rhizobium laguerreae TaxID=1076926 RepID=UPI001C91A3DA|nr:RNA-directed DNA polymerase [Rhizobium laguerreae]MBY3485820.1 RNA-directed DNA polymerase [Rhizobium laguerreae]